MNPPFATSQLLCSFPLQCLCPRLPRSTTAVLTHPAENSAQRWILLTRM